MLRQSKVDRICALIEKTALSNSQIAKLEKVSAGSVHRLRTGSRARIGKLDHSRTPEPTSFVCPNCGPVRGSYCVLCKWKELQSKGMTVESVLQEGPGPRPDDPTPEQIRTRAASIRRMHLIDSDDDEAPFSADDVLWVDMDEPLVR